MDSVYFFCFLNVSQAHVLSVLASSWQHLGRFLEISESRLLIMNKEGHGMEAWRTWIQIYTHMQHQMPEGRNMTDTLVIPDQWFTGYGFKENTKFSVNDSVLEWKAITPLIKTEKQDTNTIAVIDHFLSAIFVSNVQYFRVFRYITFFMPQKKTGESKCLMTDWVEV